MAQYTHTVAIHTQFSVGTFDVSVAQNAMRIREINKLPSIATVIT